MSVFDHTRYQAEARRLVACVDRGDYEALRAAAVAALRNQLDQWPLGLHGEDGPPQLDLLSTQTATPRDLGYLFLLILGRYLDKHVFTLPWSRVLRKALQVSWWGNTDLNLFFEGYPTYRLLKPDLTVAAPWPIGSSTEYWLWLHPQISKSGWIPADQIPSLYDRMKRSEALVDSFDVHRLSRADGYYVDNPVVERDVRQGLRTTFQAALRALAAAHSAEQGLFVSTSVYS